ncbi:MAG: galactokinase [Alphaproteobacteria bacterium]|nr:galactokinase [Alphaproteobacteria bacterium]
MTAHDLFLLSFGEAPQAVQTTPGRVNLVGEHTDYNGGMVLPMAINPHVDIAISIGPPGRASIASAQFETASERRLDERANGDWSDYVLGALRTYAETFGWRVAIDSQIPHGSGLSSSAAITVGVIKAAGKLVGDKLHDDARKIARAAQSVENDFIGVPCGIMDQMAVAVLNAGECMMLDTQTLDFDAVSIPPAWRFVVHHSGVYRRLNEGRYADRQAECESAALKLGGKPLCSYDLVSLEAASLSDLERRRARHVISENLRVPAARSAILSEDAPLFGRLMDDSHASMRDDFSITTSTIDKIVSVARSSGAFGSRMTGGGFGGCVVSLVLACELDAWRKRFERAAPMVRFVC